MSIFDAEEELNIHIPQEGDYDTIGGYVFHQTGTIPQKDLSSTKMTLNLKSYVQQIVQ